MYSPEIAAAVRDAIASNLRKESDLSIGVEVENIVYDSDLNRIPVDRGDTFSTHDLRYELECASAGSGIEPALTIEPGGQMEYASAPHITLEGLDSKWHRYMKGFLSIAGEKGLIVSDFALEPVAPADDITIIDHRKYKLMYARFSDTGSLGHEMMLNTASVQINLDYTSLEEAARLAFVADFLHPVAALLFSNAPFYRGEPAGLRNMREIIWRNTDPARSNCLIDHGISDMETLLDDFGEYVLQTPVLFTFDKDGSVGTFDGALGDWLSSLHADGKLERGDVMTALHQIFTQVRFKHVLEIRGPDRPPFGYELAPAAFFLGLLRSSSTLEKAMEVCSDCTMEQRTNLNSAVQTLDFDQSPVAGMTLRELCGQFLHLAMDGLSEKDGESYLRPFADKFLADGPFTLSTQEAFRKSGKSVEQFMRARWDEQKEFLKDYTKT